VPSVVLDLTLLKAYVEQQGSRASPSARRALEQQVRWHAREVAERLAECGYSQAEAARWLGVSDRTLRDWQALDRPGNVALPLPGRPRADAGPAQQQAVLTHLHTVGPGVGVPELRDRFPRLARAELDELLKCYRALWRDQHRRAVHVLHWQRPGTVWAMDFAKAPARIDGIYPYLLAVRDLASGQQLLWRPVVADPAEVVRAELVPLFGASGAPGVLKSDNGPAFHADLTKGLLARWGVFGLFSPPYNGAIEAAIGSLKTRSERLALAAGHPGLWTSAVVEAARWEANTTARPRRLRGATPMEVWQARRCGTAEEREQFRATVAAIQAAAWEERGGLPEAGASHRQQASVDRVALRRALVAHDLLLFRRRRIPARIERPKTAN
jgi:hypothetical protein